MTEQPIMRASFTPEGGAKIDVHFNPASLDYSISNQLPQQSQKGNRHQFASSSSARLSMELYFDTTYNGEDVRLHTIKIARLIKPVSAKGKRKAPPVVLFEWGLFKFKGIMEQFRENIDFFSSNGVPLRSKVNVTLASQDLVFEESNASGPRDDSVEVPASQSTTNLASSAGDPNAGRDIASLNNLGSMRFSTGSLTVGGEVSLKAAAGFSAGAGASAGIGAGIGIGANIGGGAGASAGIGIGASIGGGAGIGAGANIGASVSGSASAGLPASAGAFAGLHTKAERPTPRLDTERLIDVESASFNASSSTGFSVGGQVNQQSSAGLTSDVGASGSANVSPRARIQFK